MGHLVSRLIGRARKAGIKYCVNGISGRLDRYPLIPLLRRKSESAMPSRQTASTSIHGYIAKWFHSFQVGPRCAMVCVVCSCIATLSLILFQHCADQRWGGCVLNSMFESPYDPSKAALVDMFYWLCVNIPAVLYLVILIFMALVTSFKKTPKSMPLVVGWVVLIGLTCVGYWVCLQMLLEGDL